MLASEPAPNRVMRSHHCRHVMPSGGRFAGQPIDTSRSRPVSIQGERLDRFGRRRLIVDHVYHEGAFWTAVIPIDGVDQISVQFYNFSAPCKMNRTESESDTSLDQQGMPKYSNPFLNHIQLRISFQASNEIDLYPLFGEDGDIPMHSVADLCYSVEAAGPKGYDFDWRNTVFGNLVTVHRFTTMQEMVFERLVAEDQCLVESPPLPLTPTQKAEVLLRALRRSQQAGLSETYYLIRMIETNNCASNALKILDSVMKGTLRQRLASHLYRLPISPRLYLQLRGIDPDPGYRKRVRDEFHDFINAPQTQVRKRLLLDKQW